MKLVVAVVEGLGFFGLFDGPFADVVGEFLLAVLFEGVRKFVQDFGILHGQLALEHVEVSLQHVVSLQSDEQLQEFHVEAFPAAELGVVAQHGLRFGRIDNAAEAAEVDDLREGLVEAAGDLDAIGLAAFAVGDSGHQVEVGFFVFIARILDVTEPLLGKRDVACDKVFVRDIDERRVALVRILEEGGLREVFGIFHSIRHVADRVEYVFAVFEVHFVNRRQEFHEQGLGAFFGQDFVQCEENDRAAFPTHVAERQVVDQVSDIVLIVVLAGKFHKEGPGIVKEAIPLFAFFVFGLERKEVRAERPGEQFELEAGILEVFDVVNRLRDELVQFVGTVEQAAFAVNDLRERFTDAVFLAAESGGTAIRFPDFLFLGQAPNVETFSGRVT